jgi:hypothetical protein
LSLTKIKKEIADLKTKLDQVPAGPELRWEARRLLELYAQGYHDWCAPEYRKPWQETYGEMLKTHGEELSHPETITEDLLYDLGFMAWFRGSPNEEIQNESNLEFWLLARVLAPKAMEQLLLCVGYEQFYEAQDLKRRKEFLEAIDQAQNTPLKTP